MVIYRTTGYDWKTTQCKCGTTIWSIVKRKCGKKQNLFPFFSVLLKNYRNLLKPGQDQSGMVSVECLLLIADLLIFRRFFLLPLALKDSQIVMQ